MTWTIKASSTSYRFLSRWSPEYRRHAAGQRTAFVARDMCSYYDDVFKTFLAVFFGAWAIVGIPYLILIVTKTIVPSGPVWLQVIQAGTLICSGLAVIMGGLLAGAVAAFYILKYSVKGIRWLIDRAISDDPNVTYKSLIKTWWQQHKFNFCKTVVYEKD